MIWPLRRKPLFEKVPENCKKTMYYRSELFFLPVAFGSFGRCLAAVDVYNPSVNLSA
jgi:hypothetical protein